MEGAPCSPPSRNVSPQSKGGPINLKEVTKRSEIHPAIDYTASKFVQNDSDFKTWCQLGRYGWSESIFIIIFILNYFYPYLILIH
jgi:hypothetical protein